MQWFQNLRVTVKLVLSFLVVAALGAVVSALGIFHMGRISASTERLYSHELRALQAVQQANIALLYASRSQMTLLSAATRGERNMGSNAIRQSLEALEARTAEAEPLFLDSEAGTRLFRQYEASIAPLKLRMADFVALVGKQSLDSSQFDGRVGDDSTQDRKSVV